MGYRARVPMDVGDGQGGVTHYDTGDVIASVEGWDNLAGLVADGRIEEDAAEVKAAAKPEPKPAAKPRAKRPKSST